MKSMGYTYGRGRGIRHWDFDITKQGWKVHLERAGSALGGPSTRNLVGGGCPDNKISATIRKPFARACAHQGVSSIT